MSRFTKIAVVSLSLLIFSYVGLGYMLGKTDDDKAYRSLTVYGEVLQRVQEDYVDEPNLSNVTAGALHGLLESLDPFSGYLSAREYADYKEKQKNTRGEIGATVAKRFGYIVIVSVLPDSPAEKAGLRSGDIVEEIAGVKLKRSYNLNAPRGVTGRNSDNTKIKQYLNWEPSIRLKDGLWKTYTWIEREMGTLTVR